MEGIIDRFEESFAVVELENGEMQDISREQLPSDAQEGDVLIFTQADGWQIDARQTEARRVRLRRKLEALWEGNN
ncbi:MAG: DUF3006 domain-containing protein [Anaerotruncus sp.]|jgi:hypothetical protein|nr:DUF3006 domain-containing protein [Anaerotruncus sp.]